MKPNSLLETYGKSYNNCVRRYFFSRNHLFWAIKKLMHILAIWSVYSSKFTIEIWDIMSYKQSTNDKLLGWLTWRWESKRCDIMTPQIANYAGWWWRHTRLISSVNISDNTGKHAALSVSRAPVCSSLPRHGPHLMRDGREGGALAGTQVQGLWMHFSLYRDQF